MSDLDFERVRSAFLASRDLDDADRAEVLRRECGGDSAMLAEVRSLLAHHDSQRGRRTRLVLEDAVEAMLEWSEAPEERLPEQFGAFELLEVIGRGGMGTVYRARQHTPDRVVALKVIRPGMMTPAMLGRFRYEADLLARLQHPGIARIFEAGTVRAGGVDRPYFALELVSGQTIDRYVLEHDLDARRRVEVVAKVCDAVHYAHQKGVIHRDLKPANILVDIDGQPKVLDFGVARATDLELRTTTLRTHAGQLVGTLPYMSPEQVSGDPDRLDVRSDVYALGVLLFELLTGRLPHDLQEKTIADAALTIRDAEPVRLGSVAPALRGDLETIAGMALQKDPARRYVSANALAEDLRRYLAHQPINARPPSMSYQLSLFARRHRALVAGVAIAAAALLITTAISIGFTVRAVRSAKSEARQRQIAERTRDQLASMLTLPDPHGQRKALTVAEMLSLVLSRLDDGTEVPEVEADVRAVIGATYVKRAEFELAIDPLERAVELWRVVQPDHPKLAETLMNLGHARLRVGDGEGGEAAYREAVAIAERLGSPDTQIIRQRLVTMLIRRRAFAEAGPIAHDLVEVARRQGDPVLTIGMLRHLTKAQSGLGAHDDAQRSLAEASELAVRYLPADHPMRCGLLLDVSEARLARNDLEGAIEAAREAYEYAERVRRAGSFDWTTCLGAYTSLLEQADRRDELIDVLRQATAALRAEVGSDDRRVREITDRLTALQEQRR